MDGHIQSFIYIKYYKQFGEGLEMFALGRELPVSIVGAVWPQKLHAGSHDVWHIISYLVPENKLTVYITWYL